ncbi:hypothetical protein WMY93_032324 [Mugilogobius chulae]|uniref:RRM domain-containing protein n=1 Tax=Mugilogobius chulae TaxID=88201 RepID=A0AAW0MWT1_9GOBI
MSTILQLRGLDAKASAEDIRSFFREIQIPEGGVFIFGGSLGEAFIAFNTEKDGMLALQQSGLTLKDSKVDLHISSMVEVEHKLDMFLKRKKSSRKSQITKRAQYSSNEEMLPVKPVDPRVKPQVDVVAEQTVNMDNLASNNALLLGICTLLQGLPSSQANSIPCESPTEPTVPDPPHSVNPGFVRLFGLPWTITKQDICQFFQGLKVKEVLVNIALGARRGCLVKFDSFEDATTALSFNDSSLGSACVEVRTATEKMWNNALQEHENGGHEDVISQQGPLKDTMNYSKEWPRKKRNTDSRQNPSKKFKTCETTNSSDNEKHIVMVSHLPVTIVKTEIKELFGCPNIAHTDVLHLLDSEGQRTDKVFVTFNTQEDYDYAINLSGCHVGSQVIEVSPVTKEEMTAIMKSYRKPKQNQRIKKTQDYRKSGNADEQSSEGDPNARRCLYLRNMPADVQRSQIKGLFTENKLREEDITLLHDSEGRCVGEAVVQFQTQTNAAMALMHHGRKFLGSKILLTPISVKQMESILAS